MAVSLELHNTGDPGAGAEVRALVEHALSDRPGDWRVSIVGSRETDGWEMKVWGAERVRAVLHIGGKCGRAPAFGDRECAPEVAAGEGGAGVKDKSDQECRLSAAWRPPGQVPMCLPEIAVDTPLIKGSVFPLKVRKSTNCRRRLGFKLRLGLELGFRFSNEFGKS